MTPKPCNTPLVSVVIPVFNAAAVIEDAVASVQAQTFGDWELLLVNDGETDGGGQAAILERLAQDARIGVQNTAGCQGAGAARNAGMDVASGRYIAFLDADDMWHPQKLALQLDAMDRQNANLSCTAITRLNVTTHTQRHVGVPATVSRQELLRTNVIACSSAMFDRDHYGRRQMPELRRRQDFAFWLSLMEDGSRAIGVPYPLVTYRQMPASLSAPKHKAAHDTWKLYRRHLGLPVWKAGYYFSHYALRGLARHSAPRLAQRLGWMHPTKDLPQ
jgi:teichuronic acid biosynthesis glycosyltransferase TuaG